MSGVPRRRRGLPCQSYASYRRKLNAALTDAGIDGPDLGGRLVC